MEKKLQKPQNFGREVTIKGIIIVGMIILMFIPQFIIQNMVSEREYRKDEAIRSIGAEWGREQTLCGPMLTVPFVKQVENKKGEIEQVWTTYTFTPEKLDIEGSIKPQVRKQGMFEAILYTSNIVFSGGFAPIDAAALDAGTPDLSKAYLTMELSDLKGLSSELVFSLDGKVCQAEAGGSRDDYGDRGHYSVKQLVLRPRIENISVPHTFNCSIEFNGSEGLYFIPVGRTTNVELNGIWSHPRFTGAPNHNIGDESFDAKWTVLHYNRDIPDMWIDNHASFSDSAFGVELVTGADEYQQNERAVKYAMLFIVLTFVVFFFVELLTYKRIHPIQYLLVGVALLIFYTLLLSISEITGFGWAYLISAVATVGLITAYTASIFRNRRETMLLSSILAGLYAYLYFILQMEKYTLLVGSVGLFVILGVIMYVSRKVSWYRTDEPEAKQE